MSKLSPICISSDSEDNEEDYVKKEPIVVVLSDDEESSQNRGYVRLNFDKSTDELSDSPSKIKKDHEASKTPTSSPQKAIKISTKKLKWLSRKLQLAKKPSLSVKNENSVENKASTSREAKLHEDPIDANKLLSRIKSEPLQLEKALSDPHIIGKQSSLTSSKSAVPVPTSFTKEPPACSLLKYNRTETTKKCTPKKKRNINSPRKVGAFGSPEKSLTQTTLNNESFSPKKLLTTCEKRIDDNSSHNPPLFANKANSYGRLQCDKKILSFTPSQLAYLEGIEEEGDVCTLRYIDALLGFVTPFSKPSPDLCFDLLSETLLKCNDCKVSTKAYAALKRIQSIHPNVPEQMNKLLTMDFLEEVIGTLLNSPKCISLRLKSQNALKCLSFIVDVMEQEAKRKMTPQKTIAFRLLSLERNAGNIRKVLLWISTSVKLCCCDTIVPDFYAILNLFQRLLQLCISISESPDICAERLAGELLNTYSQLPNLDCRTIFLQTLPSNLLKSKFLQQCVQVFCEKEETCDQDLPCKGIQQIIENDFRRLPQKREDVSNIEARMCVCVHRSAQECEEYAVLIASSLQSYLFCHHKKLKSKPKMLPLHIEGLEELNKVKNERQLSLLDTDTILNMRDKVEEFVARLISLCPELSDRTLHVIEHLYDMRIWDPW